MKKAKNVLVSTTNSIEGMKIIKHLQPVSSHIVLGVNVFSDFLGGLSDFFGGQSSSYQKRLNSIYDDAIKKIKEACYDIGGNCVLSLKIDIDEISGKGKSMFMITAIGTAVFSEMENKEKELPMGNTKKILAEEINDLRYKNHILNKIKEGELKLDEGTWSFIINNQIEEAFPVLIEQLIYLLKHPTDESKKEFKGNLKIYIENFEEDKKIELLYSAILSQKWTKVKNEISKFIKEMYLFDFDRIIELIENEDLANKKIGLVVATFDKPYYDINDIDGYKRIKESIENSFPAKGKKTTKKQILSSKDKEVWICECGKSNDIVYDFCGSCQNDIYGFKRDEFTAVKAIKYIDEKINLIQDLAK